MSLSVACWVSWYRSAAAARKEREGGNMMKIDLGYGESLTMLSLITLAECMQRQFVVTL